MTSGAISIVAPAAAPVVAAASQFASSRPTAPTSFAETYRKVADADSDQPAESPQNSTRPPGSSAPAGKTPPKSTPAQTTEPKTEKNPVPPVRQIVLKPRLADPEAPALPLQGAKTATTDEQSPSRGHNAPAANRNPAPAAELQPHIVVAPVTVPLPALPAYLGIWAFGLKGDEATGKAESPGKQGAVKPEGANSVEHQVLSDDAALQVRIRLNAESSPAPLSGSLLKEPQKPQHGSSAGTTTETTANKPVEPSFRDSTVDPLKKTHSDVNDSALPLRLAHENASATALAPIPNDAAHPSGAVAPFISEGAAQRPQTESAAAPQRPEPASAALTHEVLPERPETTQPLRTVSLEFSPDGASDVRLRVSEHSGEVHISVHSSDASLSGRLHEGIHDLVGSLSTAGYDAEAWTPSQGRQNQHQPDDSPKKRPAASSGPGAESFSGMLQQPTATSIQEVL